MNYIILENVYLASNGILFDCNKNLLKLHRNHEILYTSDDENINKYPITIELDNDFYVDLTHHYSFYPFAHRYDGFSRIRHIENIINSKTKFILGNIASKERFENNRFEIECELFSIKNRIYHPDNNTLLRVNKLIYPYWLWGESPCAFSKESFIYCRTKYNDYFKNDKTKYNLFLTRTNVSRDILNHKEVHQFFIDHDFLIIDGKETLSDTLRLFYNANIVVGIHGGLFSNLLFCDDVKKIIEIFPSNRFNGCFIGWNEHLKTNYKTFTIKSDINDNIYFDSQSLIELEKMIQDEKN